MTKPIVLPLEEVPNARDLGGYVGLNGRKVKLHRLVRTGKMFNIPQRDVNYLADYGVNQVIDLRTAGEIEKWPDTNIPGSKHYNISVHADNKNGVDKRLEQLRASYDKDQYAGFKAMCHQYTKATMSEHAHHTYHKVLELLANNEAGATLFHCSEGKDRTGLAAVLILYILGVDMETIRQDYLYSNYLLNDYRAQMDKKIVKQGGNYSLRAAVRSLGGVANEYLDTALILMEENYGSIDNYLKQALGVDEVLKRRLQDLYLED
ncbi:protein-tyrosine phosphatase [Lactobacillus colini]|uniref:Protein-tyrosine phosphatase n=1 Tax=Lactobacillus colini TaxID=1819254 RepID=A0ABS4MEQ2_9LACO|nr:tyrosine-protein phosphatase [Lactobacillus colini]MBP2058158.1 protein-tyrosine phosphatase [Lactobacillus colini]